MNAWDELRTALNQHRDLTRAMQSNAAQMARMLVGNLRHADSGELRQLKKELEDFDARTSKWRKPR